MNEKKERNEMYEKHQISQLDWERGGVYLNVFLCRVYCFTQFNDFWRIIPKFSSIIHKCRGQNLSSMCFIQEICICCSLKKCTPNLLPTQYQNKKRVRENKFSPHPISFKNKTYSCIKQNDLVVTGQIQSQVFR